MVYRPARWCPMVVRLWPASIFANSACVIPCSFLNWWTFSPNLILINLSAFLPLSFICNYITHETRKRHLICIKLLTCAVSLHIIVLYFTTLHHYIGFVRQMQEGRVKSLGKTHFFHSFLDELGFAGRCSINATNPSTP